MTEKKILRLHFPEEIINPENVEDILTLINEGVEPKTDKHKSIISWMRSVLRNYALAMKSHRERWISTKELTIDGKRKSYPELNLWEGENIDKLDDDKGGVLVKLPVGNLQYSWLKLGVIWENTIQQEVNKTDILYNNVAELAYRIIFNALMVIQTRIDSEKLKLEEEEFEDDVSVLIEGFSTE